MPASSPSAERVAAAYDRVPYPRHAYGFTHPDRLAAIAILHGLSPPPVETCRVLEIGCASGGNIVPMAAALPGGQLVGVDLSAVQIAEAQRFARVVGVTNLRLEHRDLCSLSAADGPFDYIIAHGVHSWVPAEVQEQILRVCGELLSPSGIALVSYNAYPGCHLRQMVRGMGRYHTRDLDDPAEKVAQLHAAVRFLADSLGDQYVAYRRVLRTEAERLGQLGDAFVLHDTLEETNLPVYFHQFVAQAERHGLRFLDEALPLDRRRVALPGPKLDELRRQLNNIELEQHFDFFDGTSFRRSLICRGDLPLGCQPSEAALDRLLFTSLAEPTGESGEEFSVSRGPATASIRCAEPIAQAAMHVLAERYPRAISFQELLESAGTKASSNGHAADEANVRQLLLAGHHLSVIDIHAWQPKLAAEVSDRPVASPVARYQAAQGWEITTVWHGRMTVSDPIVAQLIASLDGQHSRGELLALTMDAALHQNPSVDHIDLEQRLVPLVNEALSSAARAGILIA